MIKVTLTRTATFEMPKDCASCPLCYSEQDGNATIYLCKLKQHLNPKASWTQHTVDYGRFRVFPDGEKWVHTKDSNCPIEDNKEYNL